MNKFSTTFNRIVNIVDADINAILARAEDPEKMLPIIIRDMHAAVDESEKKVAAEMAELKLIGDDLEEARVNMEDWAGKSVLAVNSDKDALAKEALNRKNDYKAQMAVYQKQYEDQDKFVSSLRTELDALRNKMDETERNKKVLIRTAQRSKAKKTISNTEAMFDQTALNDAYARMKEKVRREEAMVDATIKVRHSTVEDEFAALEQGQAGGALDVELAELKKSLGKA